MILNVLENVYSELSKTHKAIADYVLENYVDVAFMTITKLGMCTGSSAATITRFVKELGYSSYAAFQDELVALAKTELAPIKEYQSYVTEKPKHNVLYDQIEDAKFALSAMYSEELNKQLHAASQTLNKAQRIFILGSRSSLSIAYYCYFSLKRVKENVYLVENKNDDISINLQYINNKDVLLAISYPKYTQFSVNIVDYFAERGCKIVSMTDRYTSPIAKYATNLMIVKNRLKIYFVTTFTVINALLIMMGQLDPKANIATFEEENAITTRLGVYVRERKDKKK